MSLKSLQWEVSQEAFRIFKLVGSTEEDFRISYQVAAQQALKNIVGEKNVRAYGLQFSHVNDTHGFELYNANSEE